MSGRGIFPGARPAVIAAALSAATCAIAAPAAAQTPPPAPAPASRGALTHVVDALTAALARAPLRGLVAAAPLVSDAPAPRAAELTAALAAQLAGRRGGGSHARAEPLALPAAREAARADRALLHLTVEIAAGKLRVTADLYPVARSVWAKIRDPEPGPVAHAFAEAPLDAELRTYLAPIPLVTASVNVERARSFEGDVIALACGDLDGDGSPEIVTVSRRRVSVVRIRGGRVMPLFSRAWPDLAPVAPAPLREPIGFATLVTPRPGGPTFVDVGLTDRGKSVRLDGELHVVASFNGIAVPDADVSACTRLPGLVVTGPLGPCVPGDPAVGGSVGGQYDAFASARLVTARGEPYAVWVGRERGALELRDDAGHKGAFESVGAQLAVGDLDQDGEPEILASLDTTNPLEDAVVVRTWARREPLPLGSGPLAAHLRETLRLPAASGVHALAVCPPDGPGHAPFVVATADELWVVR